MNYPKKLETKEDYLFIRKNFPDRLWLEDFIELEFQSMENVAAGILDYNKETKKYSVKQRFNLDDPEDAKKSEIITKYLLENPLCMVVPRGDFEEVPEWEIQSCGGMYFGMLRRERKDSKLKKLGFTIEELEELMKVDMT